MVSDKPVPLILQDQAASVDRLRVCSLHAGADTGGIGWALSQAFRDSPDVELLSFVKQSNYIGYPADRPWSELQGFGQYADVIHLHNTFRTALLTGLAGKPKVIHHHGTHYRDNAERLNAEVEAAEAVAVVATLDLLDYGPHLTWCPHPYDLSVLPPREVLAGRKIRVGHAPTDRAIKSTDAFLAAAAKIPDIEPVLIEGRTWADCLALKATCDVYYDQVQLGYGCNAIEAWGMGIPVIAGASDATLDRMEETFGWLPFYQTEEHWIGTALEAMLDDAIREEYADRGLQHVHTYHSGRATRGVLEPIYRQLARR